MAHLFRVSLATAADRHLIYRHRHAVYARELGQHHQNDAGQLTDALDARNIYICVWAGATLAGFVSITPPGGPLSIDKYVKRDDLPCAIDDRTYEVRLLTVMPDARRRELAMLLMYGALRYIEARGGTRVVAIGRREVFGMYQKAGLIGTGITITSGALTFEVMHATTTRLREFAQAFDAMITRIEALTDWQLDIAFRRPAPCFHGGTFFDAIGPRFERLERRHTIINADVLDAWFPPSPRVTEALTEHLSWLLRTSPPNESQGLTAAIADARGVAPEAILPGAGSSDLIFLALRHWLTPASRALILDPTYSEYAHVLERVIGCRVDRFRLDRGDGYQVNAEALARQLDANYDLVVIVNPNSPTGRHLSRTELQTVIAAAPPTTKFWIDETYIEYVGRQHSLESLAAASSNVVICKSMSKVYALSGARAAYLCAPPHLLEGLRALTPPWAVSLVAQVAAVAALGDDTYYAGRYAETHLLRHMLAEGLSALDWDLVPGTANFVLAQLPAHGPDAESVVLMARAQGVFVRNVGNMGTAFNGRAIRVAVKDRASMRRVLDVLHTIRLSSAA